MTMKLLGIGAFQKAEDVLRRILCKNEKRQKELTGMEASWGGEVVSLVLIKKYL
jgi:hypothetical protein